jgi:hypothetical protein
MRKKHMLVLFCFIFSFTLAVCPEVLPEKKFYPDDPLDKDEDCLDIPPVEEIYISDYYDFIENSFFKAGQQESPVPAMDVNTLGEVPDSSWFTNRHAKNPMPVEALKRGPNRGGGPDMTRPWKIIRGKSGGITPGFVIRDGRDDVYFIKFDPLSNPEMASAAEMIASKFFFAAGYHVPEIYIVNISPDMLLIDEDATYKDMFGAKQPLEKDMVEKMLGRVPYREDGKIRVLASLGLAGTPAGPFKFYGTRPDDPNDIFPHENRRVLRGLYVIASWLNHDDSRSINTLDMYVEEGGRRFIRHHLIDFGSCLGSGSVKPQSYRAGWSYMFDPGELFKSIGGLGIYVPKYLKVPYKQIPSVGRFECDMFEPDQWKPEYPNPAFQNMRLSDAFWGAKIVMSFSEKEIAAICGTAALSDPAAEWYLMECLIYRAYKIGRFWFSRMLPLDRFELRDGRLHFENLAVRYEFAHKPTRYTYAWSRFDNDTGASEALGISGETGDTFLPVPEACRVPEGEAFFSVTIRGENQLFPLWRKAVTVYLRAGPDITAVVGIDREE